MQALYQASLSHTARIYCPYQSMKLFIHSVRLEYQNRKPKKCANILPQKMKQKQIVLKRSARLNIDPGRGNGGDGVTEKEKVEKEEKKEKILVTLVTGVTGPG